MSEENRLLVFYAFCYARLTGLVLPVGTGPAPGHGRARGRCGCSWAAAVSRAACRGGRAPGGTCGSLLGDGGRKRGSCGEEVTWRWWWWWEESRHDGKGGGVRRLTVFTCSSLYIWAAWCCALSHRPLLGGWSHMCMSPPPSLDRGNSFL